MQEFTTAANAVEAEEHGAKEEFHFKLDGVEMTCFRPSDGQFAVFMSQVGRYTKMADKVAGVIDLLMGVLDEDSHSHIVERLMDREDLFGVQDVMAILHWMVEVWSGRPTQSPSVSTPSQRNGGRKSTRVTPALT